MTNFFGSVWWLLVSLGILITFHEYGHYWVARRCGVKVLSFSVGFGRALWSYTARNGTEFRLGMIPLGGYVKMLGERENDQNSICADQRDHSFAAASVWKRMAITAAGPVANVLLCFVLLWAMFVIGRPDWLPVVGETRAIAADIGIQRGERIDTVDGIPTPTWSELQLALLPAALDRRDVTVTVVNAHGIERHLILPLSHLPADFDQQRVIALIGLWPRHLTVPPVVGRVLPDSPAAGLLAEGDTITAIDGKAIQTFSDIALQIQKVGEHDGQAEAMIEVLRDGQRLALPFHPAKHRLDDGSTRWVIGIEPPRQSFTIPDRDTLQQYGPLDAISAALGEIDQQTRQIVGMIGRAFSGRIALENTVAGPITIARITHAYASQGLAWYLSILALLSLSLGLLNLLPIPILDGGHLMYYIIELVKGSPLSERVMAAGHYVGLALLVALMGLAFHNDILNLLR